MIKKCPITKKKYNTHEQMMYHHETCPYCKKRRSQKKHITDDISLLCHFISTVLILPTCVTLVAFFEYPIIFIVFPIILICLTYFLDLSHKNDYTKD